jgi:ankyrin repeat protein
MARKKPLPEKWTEEPSEEEKRKQRCPVSACFHDTTLAKQIFAADPQAVHCRDGVGETTFHYVVVESRIDLAELLLQAGSDINSATLFGHTPLMSAVQLGNIELVRWLVDHGASLDPKTVNDDTALSYAAAGKHREIFDFLISLKRNHPIDYYFHYLEAKTLLRDKTHPMYADLVKLGLQIPEWLQEISDDISDDPTGKESR